MAERVEIFYKSEDGSTWNSESDGQAWNCVVAAQRYYDQKDWDGAIEMCTRGLAYNPIYEITLSLYRGLGLAQYGKGDIDAAIATFNVPIKDPANRMGFTNAKYFTGNLRTNAVSIYFNRGVAYQDKGMKENAIADYKTCIAFCDVYQDEKNLAKYRDAVGENIAKIESSILVDQGLAAYQAKDYAKAVELWKKAADMGHTGAMNNLANCNLNGWGVPKDKDKAYEWWKKAAALGHKVSQDYLTKNGIKW